MMGRPAASAVRRTLRDVAHRLLRLSEWGVGGHDSGRAGRRRGVGRGVAGGAGEAGAGGMDARGEGGAPRRVPRDEGRRRGRGRRPCAPRARRHRALAGIQPAVTGDRGRSHADLSPAGRGRGARPRHHGGGGALPRGRRGGRDRRRHRRGRRAGPPRRRRRARLGAARRRWLRRHRPRPDAGARPGDRRAPARVSGDRRRRPGRAGDADRRGDSHDAGRRRRAPAANDDRACRLRCRHRRPAGAAQRAPVLRRRGAGR